MWPLEDEGFLAPDDDDEPPDSNPPEDDELIAPEDMLPAVEAFPEGVCALEIEIRPAAKPSVVKVASVNVLSDIVVSRVCVMKQPTTTVVRRA